MAWLSTVGQTNQLHDAGSVAVSDSCRKYILIWLLLWKPFPTISVKCAKTNLKQNNQIHHCTKYMYMVKRIPNAHEFEMNDFINLNVFKNILQENRIYLKKENKYFPGKKRSKLQRRYLTLYYLCISNANRVKISNVK